MPQVQKPTKEIAEKQILLVEDDNSFRNVIRRILELNGYKVLEANNGRNAQNILGIENCDLVVSDIRLPEINGIELLHFVKRTKPIPVVLMTGYAEVGQSQEMLDLGANHFLSKPFKKEALLDILKEHFGEPPPEQAEESIDIHYCKVGIDDFIAGREMKYPIFIRLSSQKYLKIANQGADLTADRVKAFKEKNIRHLYMKKEDFGKYIDFNMILTPGLSKVSSISKIKKFNFLKNTGELILEDLYLHGVNEESFDQARSVVETSVALITEQDDLMKLLDILGQHTDFLYAHSLGVSLYGAMIAKALKWSSESNIFKVSMGGLLHDIGKKEIDREILNKTRNELTIEEVKILETNPLRGMEILRQVKGIPQDILQIALQHHENCLGLGFPVGLKKHNIHPMAKVISVANEFCNHVIKNPNSPQGCQPHEGIKKMISLQADQLDHTMVGALMEVFTYPGAEEFSKGKHRAKYNDDSGEEEPKKKTRM